MHSVTGTCTVVYGQECDVRHEAPCIEATDPVVDGYLTPSRLGWHALGMSKPRVWSPSNNEPVRENRPPKKRG